MVRQRVRPGADLLRQVATDTLPRLRAVAAAVESRLRALRSIPVTGGLVGGSDEHRGIAFTLCGSEEHKVVEVVAREAVPGLGPAGGGIVGNVEGARRRDEVAVASAGQRAHLVHVEVVNALADVLPGRTAVEAAHHSAVLQRENDDVRVIGMYEDVGHVPPVRWLRPPPVELHLVGEVLQAGQLLPAVAAILAAIEMDGAGTGVDHVFVGRIQRNGMYVSLQQLRPAAPTVVGAVEALGVAGDVDALGIARRAGHAL